MDRISNLSDDLLLKILSELRPKDVIATTLLSKRWKFFWTMVPRLDFNDKCEHNLSKFGSFRKYVDRSMVLHRAPVLQSLKFEVGPCCSSEDIATWIRIGMVRYVPELQIFPCDEYFEKDSTTIKLPKSLYTYEKLEVLKLAYNVIVDVPIDVCFPSLKALHLVCVEFKTKESHRKLLSGCPVLEELVLDKTKNSDYMRSFYVEMPTLQRLSILDRCDTINFGENGLHKIVINVPSVKYLNFVDFYGDLCLCENMPQVIEAKVKVVYESPKKLLESLPSVQNLYLCLNASMLQHRIVFYHLVHLELCQDSPEWWDLLTWMLDSSPKLQVLKLDKCNERPCFVTDIEGHWEGPSTVPDCLLSHLYTFEWKYYNGREEEKKVVAYILKNARQLKTAAFSAQSLSLEEERSLKLKELVSLPRASSSCKLLTYDGRRGDC
ncbi:putative FBD-associated F-box protein [Cardamine amara subsp. amara]|uniref:FBD-associated F-box protein n=1 Tax=Cardamine amara subsp. amara TaxID=228776 RepID=A0ABD1A1M9_CARAN